MADHHTLPTTLEDRLRDVWAALLDLTIAPGMTYANGTRAREIARTVDEIIREIAATGHAGPTEVTDERVKAGTPEPLPCGCENPLNAVHLLDHWPLRRIPAPTPPTEEVALPTEFGAVITEVKHRGAPLMDLVRIRPGYLIDPEGAGYGDHHVTTCTLPDGTRARRDGEHEDGTPRFVKVQEGEK